MFFVANRITPVIVVANHAILSWSSSPQVCAGWLFPVVFTQDHGIQWEYARQHKLTLMTSPRGLQQKRGSYHDIVVVRVRSWLQGSSRYNCEVSCWTSLSTESGRGFSPVTLTAIPHDLLHVFIAAGLPWLQWLFECKDCSSMLLSVISGTQYCGILPCIVVFNGIGSLLLEEGCFSFGGK